MSGNIALPEFIANHPAFYCFPVSAKSKKPLCRWRAESTNDPAKIAEFITKFPNCNIGIDCGKSGLVVVDVDVKRGKQGELSILALEMEGVDFDTLEVRTPSGGTHFYFTGKTASGVEWRNGIDIRSEGGYVVAPGSFLDGVPYKVVTSGNPAPIPPKILEELGQYKERVAATDTWLVEPDKDANVEACRNWLMFRAPEAIEGQGGNTVTWKVAARCKDFGLSPEKALELMLAWNEEKAQPAWQEDELDRIIQNAYAYGKNAAGCEAPEVRNAAAAEAFSLDPLPTETKRELKGRFAFMWDFKDVQPPEREWIVKDWIPKGTTVLITGTGGAGKSSILLQLEASIHTGKPWLGCLPVCCKPMKTLHVICEDPDDEVQRRSHAILNDEFRGLPRPAQGPELWFRIGENNIAAQTSPDKGLRHGTFWYELMEKLETMGDGEKLVILDTIPDVFYGNENDRSAVTQFAKEFLGFICKRHNATVIGLAHPPKNTTVEYSGSTAWQGSFRAQLFFQYRDEKAKDDFRWFSVAKQNYGKNGTRIALRRSQSGAFVKVDEAELVKPIEDAIIQVIADAMSNGQPLTKAPSSGNYFGSHPFKDMDGNLIDATAVKATVRAMLADGRVEETGKGLLSPGHKVPFDDFS